MEKIVKYVCGFVTNLRLNPSPKTLSQWFPTFLILWPHYKMLRKCLAVAITCNSVDIEITTDQMEKTPFHMLDSLYSLSCAKETAHIC